MTLDQKGGFCHIVGCAILQPNLGLNIQEIKKAAKKPNEDDLEKTEEAQAQEIDQNDEEKLNQSKKVHPDENSGKIYEKVKPGEFEAGKKKEEQRNIFEGDHIKEQFLDVFYARILEQSEKNLRNNQNLRKLRQNFGSFLGVGYWKNFNSFEIKDHVKILQIKKNQDEIYEFMNQHANQIPFEPSKPKWNIFVFKDDQDRNVLIWKLHHSLGDGISIISSMLYLGNCHNIKTVRINTAKRSLKAFLWGIPQICIFFANLLCLSVANTMWNREKSQGKILSYRSKNLDFRELKYYARKNKILINDVIISLISTTFHRLYERKFGRKLDSLKIFIAASLRKIPNKPGSIALSNKINFFIQKLQETEWKDPNSPNLHGSFDHSRNILSHFLKNATFFHHELKKMKSSLVLLFQSFLTKLIYGFLPVFCTHSLIASITKKIFVVFSSLPGPLEKVKLYGEEVEDVFFFVNGLQNMRIVLNVMSYDGKINLGVTSDSGCGVKAKEFVQTFEEIYGEEVKFLEEC
jgi:hypothetical protein